MYGPWTRKGIQKFTQFFQMDQGRLKTFNELAQKYDLPKSHFLIFLQVTNHMKGTMKDMAQAFKRSVADGCISKGTYATRNIYPSMNKLFINQKLSQPRDK